MKERVCSLFEWADRTSVIECCTYFLQSPRVFIQLLFLLLMLSDYTLL